MSDIAGVGSFGASIVRSNANEDRAIDPQELAQRRAEERAALTQNESSLNTNAVSGQGNAVRESTNDASNTSDQDQQTPQDRITLSAQPRQAAEQSAANENQAAAAATPAAGEVSAIESNRQTTNQAARLETSTSEVNGNQDSQSEGTRTLGQIVDQFA